MFIFSIRIFYTLVLDTNGGAATFSVWNIIHYLCMYGGHIFGTNSRSYAMMQVQSQ